MAQEQIIHSTDIFNGRVVHLRVDTIERDDGRTYQREIIQHSGAVAVVALDSSGSIYLVRQHRAGAGRDLLELPAGGLEPNEATEVCARRELQEEIGCYPDTLYELGGFYVAASYTSEYITVFLAQDLRPSRLPGDIDEDISVELVPFAEALRMALTNQIEDSKTLIGLIWAARHLGYITP
jgi:ADP-ribose pyrophosphatase